MQLDPCSFLVSSKRAVLGLSKKRDKKRVKNLLKIVLDNLKRAKKSASPAPQPRTPSNSRRRWASYPPLSTLKGLSLSILNAFNHATSPLVEQPKHLSTVLHTLKHFSNFDTQSKAFFKTWHVSRNLEHFAKRSKHFATLFEKHSTPSTPFRKFSKSLVEHFKHL